MFKGHKRYGVYNRAERGESFKTIIPVDLLDSGYVPHILHIDHHNYTWNSHYTSTHKSGQLLPIAQRDTYSIEAEHAEGYLGDRNNHYMGASVWHNQRKRRQPSFPVIGSSIAKTNRSSWVLLPCSLRAWAGGCLHAIDVPPQRLRRGALLE
jgi:hypothetical protein